VRTLLSAFLLVLLALHGVTAPVFADDTITVTATIPGSGAGVQTAFVESSDTGVVQQYEEVEYTLTYSNVSGAAIPITLRIDWYQGVIDGTVAPSVDVVEYVYGSATQGYGSTTPIVDVTNRHVTWSIASVPAGTLNQTVRIRLRATTSYTGPNTVHFGTKALVISPTGVPDIEVDKAYRYVTPTPTPTPTSTPTATLTATTTPGAAPSVFAAPSSTPLPAFTPPPTTTRSPLTALRFVEIGDRYARIDVTLQDELPLKLRYGTSPLSLTWSEDSAQPHTLHNFYLQSLTPQTPYFIQIWNTAVQQPLIPELFTFTTATELPDDGSVRSAYLLLSERGGFIYGSSLAGGIAGTKPMHIVAGSTLQVVLQFPHHNTLLENRVLLRRADVLGASDENHDRQYNDIERQADALRSAGTALVEVTPGLFVGSIKTSKEHGAYELVSVITHDNGYHAEQAILHINLLTPMTAVDQRTRQGITGVKATIHRWNTATQRFEPSAVTVAPFLNPAFSEPDGAYTMNFSPGTYEVQFAHPQYVSQTTRFAVGDNGAAQFPYVSLVQKPLLARVWIMIQAQWSWWLVVSLVVCCIVFFVRKRGKIEGLTKE
jgi:hypothetical protein